MTQLLEKVIEKASALPRQEQDAFARLMLAELQAEQRWNELLEQSQSEDLLEKMAEDAQKAHREGRTSPLDPELM